MNAPRSLLAKHARRPLILALSALGITASVGCTSLPDTEFQTHRYREQATRMNNARGPLTQQQSAAIVAALKRKSGDLDILDKQLALEQAIVGSPLVLGNRVQLLQDGPATYAAMFAAIAAAQDHIQLESYIIEDDDMGRRFAELLLQQQARGVQVNLIYDSLGALNTPRAFFERLRAAGVRVLEFNPMSPLATRLPWAPNHRDHRKLLIVDGRTAFLGGINISSVYSSGSVIKALRHPDAAAAGWRDTDIRIDGPVVAEFQKLFLQTWATQKGAPLAPRQYFPELSAQGGDIVCAIGSSPNDPFSLIYLTLISAIGNAEREVFIANAYFVPDPQLIAALLQAAKRGVDVRLLLPSRSDSRLAFHAGRSYYAELLAGGVQIHERRDSVLHVKTALIDAVWSCVGSSNLDWRSALDNDEVNAVTLGRDFARDMRAAYLSDLQSSDVIEPGAWEQRPLLMRFKESVARLFGRLL